MTSVHQRLADIRGQWHDSHELADADIDWLLEMVEAVHGFRALTMTQTARLLGVAVHTMRELVESGEVPFWFQTPSGRYMFSSEALLRHQARAAERGAA